MKRTVALLLCTITPLVAADTFEEMRMAAEQGDMAAQYKLGEIFDDGLGVPEDDEQALKWYRRAAKQGHARARESVCFLTFDKELYEEALEWCRKAGEQGDRFEQKLAQKIVGKMYFEGLGVSTDYQEATKWLRSAAAFQGPESLLLQEAAFQLGYIFFVGGNGVQQDHEEAARWWLKIADSETAEYLIGRSNLLLMYSWLGALYDDGSGLPKNGWEASKWYRKAADGLREDAQQGDWSAQFNLANMYANGNGVPQDDQQAIKWLRECAENSPDAALRLVQFELGKIYAKDGGAFQNYIQAHFWLNLAAANGQQDAATERDAIAKKMTSEQISEAQSLAREWWEKQGN